MPLPVIAPQIQFSFNTRELDRVLTALQEGGAITAAIYNDAHNEDGTYYWRYVNDGRGPVRPKNAKVLHWVDANGKDVFATYSKGVPPMHMRENAVAVVNGELIPGEFQGLSRDSIQRFVNAVAKRAVEEMAKRTPVRTGKLQSSYRIGEEK